MAATEPRSRKPCCMVSELLVEAGIDREQLRRARRQILEGVILLCEWQLQRMHSSEPRPASGARRSRKVPVD